LISFSGSKEHSGPRQRVGQGLSGLDEQEVPRRRLQRDEEKLSQENAVSSKKQKNRSVV